MVEVKIVELLAEATMQLTGWRWCFLTWWICVQIAQFHSMWPTTSTWWQLPCQHNYMMKMWPVVWRNTNCFLNHKICWSLLFILYINYQGHWYYISFYLVVLSKLTIINQNSQACLIFRHFMVVSTYFILIFYLLLQIQIILYFRNYFKIN